ncbi:beta-lactamase [Sphingopyxis lindanitolerans]|uniref:Beta-lactamase n=1 Tax=Sphingopyxis lindanitolerans TaxID=2054227 RepID=A0A2S8BAX4_9SPHN|nr:serine hydrolase domain-containing protein [Sphingopyxis lindanitolerans]PQM29498.1 beta-lactamase [Sphingopyxis lindanitolerans]
MNQYLDFQLNSEFANDALRRCARVTEDLVETLGNLGALVSIDVDGIGRATFTAGHSNLEKTRSVQVGDVYQIGSQSKTITAMILFLMARDGLLDLDDPVRDYLDLPIDRRITVRHLLMNASGLGEFTMGMSTQRLDPRINFAPRDLVALAFPQGQIFEPGARFDYCNTGWVIAAMMIEAISGRSYGDMADARIVKPLGLMNSGFGGTIPAGEPMRGYMDLPFARDTIDTSECLSWAFGAGDGVCSADDILAIYQSLLRPDSALKISLDDLARETMKPDAAPYFPMSWGTEYGLGLERRAWAGSEVWGHPGSTGPCGTSTWIDSERRVAVTTAVTHHMKPGAIDGDLRYPRAQLFAMALSTGYALAHERDQSCPSDTALTIRTPS